jgi:hypothetical protein
MADTTGGGDAEQQDPQAERVEALARKLLRNAGENGLDPGDIDAARRSARRMLEDSDARVNDPAARDPEHDGVIRRSSSETASSGDTQSRRTSSGD